MRRGIREANSKKRIFIHIRVDHQIRVVCSFDGILDVTLSRGDTLPYLAMTELSQGNGPPHSDSILTARPTNDTTWNQLLSLRPFCELSRVSYSPQRNMKSLLSLIHGVRCTLCPLSIHSHPLLFKYTALEQPGLLHVPYSPVCRSSRCCGQNTYLLQPVAEPRCASLARHKNIQEARRA